MDLHTPRRVGIRFATGCIHPTIAATSRSGLDVQYPGTYGLRTRGRKSCRAGAMLSVQTPNRQSTREDGNGADVSAHGRRSTSRVDSD